MDKKVIYPNCDSEDLEYFEEIINKKFYKNKEPNNYKEKYEKIVEKIKNKIKYLNDIVIDMTQSPFLNIGEKMSLLVKNIAKREVLQEMLEDK